MYFGIPVKYGQREPDKNQDDVKIVKKRKKKESKLAKYTGPSNKLFRNFGVTDLSNRKLVSSLRQTASGQHGAARKKLSDYALHLNEKQKSDLLI